MCKNVYTSKKHMKYGNKLPIIHEKEDVFTHNFVFQSLFLAFFIFYTVKYLALE